MLYKIYTENVNRDRIEKAAEHWLGSFTIYAATGCCLGIWENSLVIEVVGSAETILPVQALADAIKLFNKQDWVLVTRQPCETLSI